MQTNVLAAGVSAEELLTNVNELQLEVDGIVHTTPAIDVHTHLFPPQFGPLCLSGIDELLTYHYLIVELFRSTEVSTESFWKMRKAEQADLVWRALFVENTPIS